ncbi:MAG: PhoH family protein [Planctomycetota bacterium]
MEITIPIEDPSRRGALYGNADRNLRLIRSACDVRISARDSQVRISGEEPSVRQAVRIVEELQRILQSSPDISDERVESLISSVKNNHQTATTGNVLDVFQSSVCIQPKGEGQVHYVQSIQSQDLTFCLGPAGTGKTYLAAAVSASLLKQHKIKRIVLVRPAVEAGEKLGYLPGDLQAKVNPYLRPLFDAMHDMMSFDQLKRFMQNDVIEVVPLAFMRGRTLNNAAIILDEAQNATVSQMLMFLTRLGHGSKMIVTGDDSQSDLDDGKSSGLRDALRRLEGVEGIAVVRLTKMDIVRHPLVQKVVEKYGRDDQGVR